MGEVFPIAFSGLAFPTYPCIALRQTFTVTLIMWHLIRIILILHCGLNLSISATRLISWQTDPDLAVGTTRKSEMKGGEVYTYRVHLNTGQFLYAVVDQQGIDLVVKTLGPDGQQITVTDSPNAKYGLEPVAFIAESTGIFQIQLSAPNKHTGKYTIQLVTLREATSTDQEHVAAEKNFGAGQQLLMQHTAATTREAIKKFQLAEQF